MMQRTVDTVIFDLGGVLLRNGSPRDIARQFPDAPADQVVRALMGSHHEDTDHPWHRLERGEITFDACRTLQGALLAEAGVTLPTRPGAGDRHGGGGGFSFIVNEPMIELVAALRANGVRTGILTNNVREIRPMWWELQPWPALFDDVVDSHEVGMRKPNPAIYHLALERLGATADRTAFCDDLAANVDAAAALGLHGVVVDEDPTAAIARVRALAGLN